MKSFNKLAIVAAVFLSMPSVSVFARGGGVNPPPPRAEPFPGPKVYDANGRLVGTWFAPTGVGLQLSGQTYPLSINPAGLEGGLDPMTGAYLYYPNSTCSGTPYLSVSPYAESGLAGLVAFWTFFVRDSKLYQIEYSTLRKMTPKSSKWGFDGDCNSGGGYAQFQVIPNGGWRQVYDLSLFKPPFSVR